MPEMIAKDGVASHEGKQGRRVDGDFYPVCDKWGMVIDYKYNHKKCWHCGSQNVRVGENDLKICEDCGWETNAFSVRLKKVEKEVESKRSRDAYMRKYKYYVMQHLPKESWPHP